MPGHIVGSESASVTILLVWVRSCFISTGLFHVFSSHVEHYYSYAIDLDLCFQNSYCYFQPVK